MKLLPCSILVGTLGLAGSNALSITARGGQAIDIIRDCGKRDFLQDIVTWDEGSVFIRGERVMLWPGELSANSPTLNGERR